MKDTENKSLENLIETVTRSKLPNWAKTTIAVSVGITPVLELLVPLILLTLVLNFLAKLLGL
jgi:hypothetical protein